MIKKEMIAMLLAGGQGSRLGVLTQKVAKPAVSFGGKYRIIDFPLSNCINSGVDTVGVLTQYQPLRLNSHIGIGIPWDLDRNVGGVTILPPYEDKGSTGIPVLRTPFIRTWSTLDSYNPEYVLIFPATTSIKWIMRLCWNITKRITQMSPSHVCRCRSKRQAASVS